MKMRALILSLLLTVFAAPQTEAQNVLVPKDNPPASASLPSTTAPAAVLAAPSIPLNDFITGRLQQPGPYQGDQSDAPAVYLPAAQQNNLIMLEKQSLAAQQQSVAQLKRYGDTLTDKAANAKTDQERQDLTQKQEQNKLAIDHFSSRVKQIQQRLAILQAGPVKMSDMTTLYQGGF